MVRGIDGEAKISDLIDLRQSVEAQKTDEGWLIAARRISRAARDEVNKDEHENLFCYTLDELIDETADFTNYVNWLEAEVKKRNIDRMYVPLACTKEEFNPMTKQKTGLSRYDEQDGWIDGYVDMWIDDPAKEHLSILGEFGTGKTWFSFNFAWNALLKYKEAKGKVGVRAHIQHLKAYASLEPFTEFRHLQIIKCPTVGVAFQATPQYI